MQDPSFQGYYDQGSDCPTWARGYDCRRDGTENKERLPKEYNEVEPDISWSCTSCMHYLAFYLRAKY